MGSVANRWRVVFNHYDGTANVRLSDVQFLDNTGAVITRSHTLTIRAKASGWPDSYIEDGITNQSLEFDLGSSPAYLQVDYSGSPIEVAGIQVSSSNDTDGTAISMAPVRMLVQWWNEVPFHDTSSSWVNQFAVEGGVWTTPQQGKTFYAPADGGGTDSGGPDGDGGTGGGLAPPPPSPSPHRYWRIYPGYVNYNYSYTAYEEIEMRNTVGGANMCGSGTVLLPPDAMAYVGGSTDTVNLFDGNTATIGYLGTDGTSFVGYDFGAGNECVVAELAFISEGNVNKLICGTLAYSDDDVFYTVLGRFGDDFTVTAAGTAYVYEIFDYHTLEMPLSPAAPHRYWRFLTERPSTGGLFGYHFNYVSELWLQDDALTDLTTVHGGSASSLRNQSGFPASGAFDRDTNTAYADNKEGIPTWFQWDFGAGNGQVVTRYAVQSHDENGYGVQYGVAGPQGWRLQASDDGNNWTTMSWVYTTYPWDNLNDIRRWQLAELKTQWRITIEGTVTSPTLDYALWALDGLHIADTVGSEALTYNSWWKIITTGVVKSPNYALDNIINSAPHTYEVARTSGDPPTQIIWKPVSKETKDVRELRITSTDTSTQDGNLITASDVPVVFILDQSLDDGVTWHTLGSFDDTAAYDGTGWQTYSFLLDVNADFTFDYAIDAPPTGVYADFTFDYVISPQVYADKLFDYAIDAPPAAISKDFSFTYGIQDSSGIVPITEDFVFDYGFTPALTSDFTFTYALSVIVGIRHDFAFDFQMLPTFTTVGLPAMRMPPEAPIVETLAYVSNVIQSYDSTEQRASLAQFAYSNVALTFVILDDDDRRQFMIDFMGVARGICLVPQWQYGTNMKAAALGAGAVEYDPTTTDIRSGDYIYYLTPQALTGYVGQVVNINPTGATLLAPLLATMPAGSWLMPARKMHWADGNGVVMQSIAGSASVNMSGLGLRSPMREGQAAGLVPSFDGLPLLNVRPLTPANDLFTGGDLVLALSADQPTEIFSPFKLPVVAGTRSFLASRGQGLDFWREFLNLTAGQRAPFLMPSFRADLIPVSVSGYLLRVSGQDYLRLAGFPAYSRIAVQTGTGVTNYKIVGAEALSGDTVIQTSVAITGTIKKISYLNQFRLSSDTIKLTHDVSNVQVDISVRTTNE